MKKVNYLIIGIVLAVTIVIGITSTGFITLGEEKEGGEIKIGVMAMMTGPFAYIGENNLRTIELTLEELRYSDRVKLIIEDTGQNNNLSQTISSYRKLVDIDKVEIIYNIMTTDGTMAVAPLLEKDKIVMITPGTGGRQIDLASPYLFRNGPSDIKAGEFPAYDLYNLFNYNQIVIFTDNAEYTLGIREDFKNNFKGEVVLDEILLLNKKDYRTEVLKILNKDYDAIIINSQDGLSAGYIIKEIFEKNIEKPIFINFFAYNQNSIDIAGEGNFEGIYVYAPEFNEDSEYTVEFFKKFKENYGSFPVVPFHTTGTYDAIKMMVEAVDVVGYDGEKIRRYLLENIQDWQGMNGVVSFDENGNTETGFVLKQVKNGELVFP